LKIRSEVNDANKKNMLTIRFVLRCSHEIMQRFGSLDFINKLSKEVFVVRIGLYNFL